MYNDDIEYDYDDGPTYIPLIAPNGVSGTIDLETGALVVSGRVMAYDDDLTYLEPVTIVTGAGRLKKFIKRVIKKAPLRRLAGAFGKIAKVVGPLIPPPYGPAISAAGKVASVASRIGRSGNTRQEVSNLARVALDQANPQSPRAREVLGQVDQVLQGRIPEAAARAFEGGQAAMNLARRLGSGDPSAVAASAELVRNAATNPRAATALNILRGAYRAQTQTSGFSEDLERGAKILWGAIRPKIGVRPTQDLTTMRDRYIDGVDIAVQMMRPV